MAYTLIHANPLSSSEPNPDVVVSYDHSQKHFTVTIVATNSVHHVQRGNLISANLNYKDLIIDKILSECKTDEQLEVAFTTSAENEVHMIWMENCEPPD